MDILDDFEFDKSFTEKLQNMKTTYPKMEISKERQKKRSKEIPRRKKSVVIPPRKRVFITPDKLQCKSCTCYPKDEPYSKHKKIRPCLHNSPTLYELAANVLDSMKVPDAFSWDVEDVIGWLVYQVELPEYQECMLVNKINGRRLLLLEDPSKLPMMNITYFEHIKMITSAIRKLFGLDFIRFSRSIGLPHRRPMINITAFKARTGPSWGMRQNWTYSDILRWMKILRPTPIKIDHWDLVWYLDPDFPKTLFARIPPRDSKDIEKVPICTNKEKVDENMVPRKFRLHKEPSIQLIYVKKQLTSRQVVEMLLHEPPTKTIQYPIRKTLTPQIDSLTGLIGKDLILAKRKLPTPKFMPDRLLPKKMAEEQTVPVYLNKKKEKQKQEIDYFDLIKKAEEQKQGTDLKTKGGDQMQELDSLLLIKENSQVKGIMDQKQGSKDFFSKKKDDQLKQSLDIGGL